MPHLPSSIATKLFVLVFWCACAVAEAAPVAQVVNLSGPLFALDAKGGRRILSIGSSVEPGETLITEGNTYAQVRFIDKGVVTLKPGTQFRIEAFAYDEKLPEKDSASFGLFKGALRTVTGLIGKRGNQDAYKMATPTATIGIRGTQFVVQFVPEEETALSFVPYALPLLARLDEWTETLTDVPMTGLLEPIQLAQAPGGLPPGTYVHVIFGAVAMNSNLPSLPGLPALPPITIPSGQTGFAPPPAPGKPPPVPVIIPTPPAMAPTLTLPPAFQSSQNQGQQGPAGQLVATPPASSQQQQGGGDGCVMR
jgi:hypothetical protein